MAPPARKIAKPEWKRHEDNIHNLYHVRGLPLHSEKGEPSVQQIMQDEFNFSASLSQYEAYFRKCDLPKNLKKEEWRVVHAKLSELNAMGVETRVKLSGNVLSKESIDRRRRHAFPGLEQPRNNASDKLALPPPNRVTIETRGADGQWSAYTGGNAVPDNNTSPLAVDHAVLEPEESSAPESMFKKNGPFLSDFEFSPSFLPPASNGRAVLELEGSSSLESIHEHGALLLGSHESLQFGSLPPSWNEPFCFTGLDLSVGMGSQQFSDLGLPQFFRSSPLALPGSLVCEHSFAPQYWAEDSLFSQGQVALSEKPRRDIHHQCQSPEYAGAGREWNSALVSKPRVSLKSHVQELLQDAAQVLNCNSMSSRVLELPDPDDVLDSLLSLLPESPAQAESEQVDESAARDIIFDSPFHSALLYSIANGFVGLQNIPSGAILGILRKQHQMSSQLFEFLRSCPLVLAKSLAENLFRAAVEACDEQAVIVIFQITRNSPNAIDPNEIVCKLHGEDRSYTPIELAAKLRHLGIVKILLAANADVNKTYGQFEGQERGALELAVRKWGKHIAVDMKLVQMLLDCHAEVRVHLVELPVRGEQKDLIRELFSRILPNSHSSYFKSSYLKSRYFKSRYFENNSTMEYIANNLENTLATQIIKQLFEYCQAENCISCPAKNQEVIERTLCNAVKRGNVDLINFLLRHATRKDAALSAAIRYGSRELIDLLFQHGASVGGPISYPDGGANPKFGPPSTPLAEAIRRQDQDLLQKIENLGALSHINQSEHFEAAIFATAEVGDCHYMHMLIERVPKKRGDYLTPALSIAIRKDKTEAALILLNNGADVNADYPWFSPPLLEALKRQNKAVVEAILEADVNVNSNFGIRSLESAVLWGNLPIIKDLIFMGAATGCRERKTALAAALKSKNKTVVDLLLKSGAMSSKHAESGPSCLEAAINNADDDMIRLLIFNGADPADSEAFLSAIKDNRGAFSTLLEIFCARHPEGKKDFGGCLLIKAIENQDDALLNTMLAANFDLNSFSRQGNELLTALGFAIIHKKGCDVGLVQKLIDNLGDPNGIVRKPCYNLIDEVRSLETALLVAIKTRNEQMVELLLRNGASAHRPARRGLKRTPLQQACEISSFKMVKLLLNNGASVNEDPADRGGATALQLASISGSIKIATLLLACGASVHESPAKVNGRSALEGAAEHGCLELIGVLWDAVNGKGFTPEQIENAISLAKSRGHRGCAEYIATLSSAANFSLL